MSTTFPGSMTDSSKFTINPIDLRIFGPPSLILAKKNIEVELYSSVTRNQISVFPGKRDRFISIVFVPRYLTLCDEAAISGNLSAPAKDIWIGMTTRGLI